MVHSRRCAFPVTRAQAKKTRQGLNSLSNFQAHEKMVHWTITRFLIFMLVKKQSTLAVAPFQFLGRKKKWSTGPFF